MRFVFPVLLGILGVAVLCALGIWQVQRLNWKTAILAEIDARIVAAPVAVPATPDPEADRYLPVTVFGRLTGQEAHVLIPSADGPGYRIVAAFDADTGRRIMVDLGFVPQDAKGADRSSGDITVTGNLHWPQEVDSWTAAPDPSNIWFARDVAPMAAFLESEEVLVIARRIDGAAPDTRLMPVDSAAIKNDHLTYAITWFSLAAVWAAMSVMLVWRNRKAA